METQSCLVFMSLDAAAAADALAVGAPRCQRGRWQTAQVRHAELLEERKITALIRAEEVMRMRARRILLLAYRYSHSWRAHGLCSRNKF